MPSAPSICRFCHANCAIEVELANGRPLHVAADRANPIYHGFTCVRGRQLAALHTAPERLLHTQRRGEDGRFEPIASARALDEIAARVRALVATHGPNAIALYIGTYAGVHPASAPFGVGFLLGLGSRMLFSAATIDQPGKPVASALHGRWLGGSYTFDESDVWMLVGNNPLVSISGGIPPANPGLRLKQARARGMRLIAVDPRRTELARFADTHLAIRPGEDPLLLAALLHTILREGREDADFLAAHARGLAELRGALAPFAPEAVAARCGVTAPKIVTAARLFASSRRGAAVAGTGPNLAPNGTLTEYLLLCLMTVCGMWRRAGEPVANPGALLPPALGKAQAEPPRRASGFSPKLRVRGLANSAAGLPTAALAEEILAPGEGQIRALFVLGGNPVNAWPDQLRTVAALRALDLLVCFDRRLAETAQLAHYVIAPKLAFEAPGLSLSMEALEQQYVGHGYSQPYAQYAPALCAPPLESDVLEEWEAFFGLAQRLGTPLRLHPARPDAGVLRAPRAPVDVDLARKPSSDEVLGWLCAGSRVPLDEVKRHPHGALFPDPACVVAEADPGARPRLELADASMLARLAALAAPRVAASADAEARPFRLISRRLPNAYNSSGRELPALARGRAHNPAFLHPDDLAALGVTSGDVVRIASARAAILAVAKAAPELRRGVVSLAHGYGATPGGAEDADPRLAGSPVARLIASDDCPDPHTGIPRMSAIPVSVERAGRRVESP